MFSLAVAMKEWREKSLPIELEAATTLGSYMHMGTIYYLLFTRKEGRTPKGRDNFPITFSMILSPYYTDIPPS